MVAGMVKLYSYFRSSAAYRVRIALNLKQIPYEYQPIHLLRNGGEQHSDAYTDINPLGLVPTLVDGPVVLSQSMAIMEYLDEAYPQAAALLPAPILQRARARELAQLVACDIHPINNLRVLRYLSRDLDIAQEQINQWYVHWIETGFAAFERILQDTAGHFCVADEPSIADCCLIPQIYNAQRFEVDLRPYKNILRVYQRCQSEPAFIEASPEKQPDAA